MRKSEISNNHFTKTLIHWHKNDNDRQYPWTRETDPYKIWLSEIILQQTRADQGEKYYLRFLERFPDVHQLARAPEDEVFLLWQGLGYYQRCKNLLSTAREISRNRNGIFPNDYASLLALKGIGPYTAAAISSFAFNLPYAVLDGNVFRVLSRYFGISAPIDSSQGKKCFQSLAQDLLPRGSPADFNQGIMDFGAAVCKPKAPECGICPLSEHCVAFNAKIVGQLPVKEKQTKVRTRNFHFLFIFADDLLYIRKRTAADIWQGLYEPFSIEGAGDLQKQEQWLMLEPFIIDHVFSVHKSKQRLSHQLILGNFHFVDLSHKPTHLDGNGVWISVKDIGEYAFPKSILSFLNNNTLLLNRRLETRHF